MADRRTLAHLLANSRTLEPSEVVTLLVPLAGELAEMHRSGRVCASVGTETVVLADDGRPTFASVAVEAADVAPADDVRALAALGWLALTGRPADRPGAAPVSAPPALIDALLSVLFAGTGRAPDAATFANAVLRSCTAEPIRLTAVTPQPVPVRRPRRSGLGAQVRRRAGTLAAAAAALVAAVVAGVAWGRHGGDAAVAVQPRRTAPVVTATASPVVPASLPAPRPQPVDWTVVVTRIEQARAAAYVTGDTRELGALYSSNSAVGARDLAMLRQLRVDHLRVRKLHAHVFAVALLRSTATSARCRVVDAVSPYVVVNWRGIVVQRRPATRKSIEEMRLARVGGHWRVADIKRVP